jgi:uncharacterized lipoprotein YddW (UPF0748 family)
MRSARTVTLLIALLLALPGAGTSAAETPDEEFRAFWVDAFGEGIYTAEQVDELVAAASAANMNAIIAQVGRRGDCFCNNAALPRTEAAIDPLPYDPLQTLIDKAHAAGIEVHAWMNVGTMWNLPWAPQAPEHVFNRHGPDAEGRDDWLNVRDDGVDRVGNNFNFDLGHPDVIDYHVETITSVAEHYDVDGINLDYIRYPDWNATLFQNDWGYNPTSLARFQAATGREDTPEPTDEEWAQWRRDQVTNLVRRLYLALHDLDPAIRFSVNTVTYLYGPQEYDGWENTAPYAGVLQDWHGWMAEGIVDLNVPMNYKRDWLDDQRVMYSQWSEAVKDWQYDRQAVIGSAAYLNHVDNTVAQVREALAPSEAGNSAVGWTGYSYRTPTIEVLEGEWSSAEGRDELIGALTEESEHDDVAPPVFADDASVPAMPWKAEPAAGHVAGSVVTRDGEPVDGIEVRVHAEQGRDLVATTVTDGSGWFGAVDLAPGRYRVELPPASVEGPRLTRVTVEAGELADASLRPHRVR